MNKEAKTIFPQIVNGIKEEVNESKADEISKIDDNRRTPSQSVDQATLNLIKEMYPRYFEQKFSPNKPANNSLSVSQGNLNFQEILAKVREDRQNKGSIFRDRYKMPSSHQQSVYTLSVSKRTRTEVTPLQVRNSTNNDFYPDQLRESFVINPNANNAGDNSFEKNQLDNSRLITDIGNAELNQNIRRTSYNSNLRSKSITISGKFSPKAISGGAAAGFEMASISLIQNPPPPQTQLKKSPINTSAIKIQESIVVHKNDENDQMKTPIKKKKIVRQKLSLIEKANLEAGEIAKQFRQQLNLYQQKTDHRIINKILKQKFDITKPQGAALSTLLQDDVLEKELENLLMSTEKKEDPNKVNIQDIFDKNIKRLQLDQVDFNDFQEEDLEPIIMELEHYIVQREKLRYNIRDEDYIKHSGSNSRSKSQLEEEDSPLSKKSENQLNIDNNQANQSLHLKIQTYPSQELMSHHSTDQDKVNLTEIQSNKSSSLLKSNSNKEENQRDVNTSILENQLNTPGSIGFPKSAQNRSYSNNDGIKKDAPLNDHHLSTPGNVNNNKNNKIMISKILSSNISNENLIQSVDSADLSKLSQGNKIQVYPLKNEETKAYLQSFDSKDSKKNELEKHQAPQLQMSTDKLHTQSSNSITQIQQVSSILETNESSVEHSDRRNHFDQNHNRIKTEADQNKNSQFMNIHTTLKYPVLKQPSQFQLQSLSQTEKLPGKYRSKTMNQNYEFEGGEEFNAANDLNTQRINNNSICGISQIDPVDAADVETHQWQNVHNFSSTQKLSKLDQNVYEDLNKLDRLMQNCDLEIGNTKFDINEYKQFQQVIKKNTDLWGIKLENEDARQDVADAKGIEQIDQIHQYMVVQILESIKSFQETKLLPRITQKYVNLNQLQSLIRNPVYYNQILMAAKQKQIEQNRIFNQCYANTQEKELNQYVQFSQYIGFQ